jgi:hypothetical protein
LLLSAREDLRIESDYVTYGVLGFAPTHLWL